MNKTVQLLLNYYKVLPSDTGSGFAFQIKMELWQNYE